MTLVWAMIDDTTDDANPNDIGTLRPAYHDPYIFGSPNGNWVAGQSTGTAGYQSTWLVDTSVNPPVNKWIINSSIAEIAGDSPYSEPVEFVILAVDDDGDVWGKTGFNDGLVLKLANADGAASIEFEWTDDGGKSDGLTPRAIYTFTDGGTKVLVYPEGEVGNDNVRGLLGTKDTPGLTTFSTGGFFTWDAFRDGNGDIWMAGAGSPPTTSMSVKRITSISSEYPASQTFTMPANGRAPVGAFRDGSYVGGWRDTDSDVYENLFSAVLDGSGDVTTSAANLLNFGSSDIVGEVRPLTNPDHFFFITDTDPRSVVDINADLSEGDSWNLDDWAATDTDAPSGDPAAVPVTSPIYLPGPNAFAGARNYIGDYPGGNDLHVGELFLYYLGEPPAGDGGDPTLRVWGFSLDGHDFYCLRLGDSETLVYDLTTGQWADWRTFGRTNWRAITGQNWVGASSATMARGWTDIVAGDDTEGLLWILDPSVGVDDNVDTGTTAFTRVVTGGVTLTGRQTVPCGAVTLDLNLGAPAMTGAAITLRTSDDQGENWTDHGAITIAVGDTDAVIEWRALGLIRAPGRVFEFSDNGAAVRLNLADMR